MPSRSLLRESCSSLDLAMGTSMLPDELELSLPSSVCSGLICASELGCGSSQAAVLSINVKETTAIFA